MSGLLALLLDHAATVHERQLGIIRNRLGASIAEEAATLAAALAGSAEEDRLALADLAFPVLRLQPAIRRDYLAATIDRLSSVDDEVDLFEAMLRARVAAALTGATGPRPAAADDHALAAAATRLLAALALERRGEPTSAAAAFAAGHARLAPEWPVSADTSLPGRRPPSSDLRRDLETTWPASGRPAPGNASTPSLPPPPRTTGSRITNTRFCARCAAPSACPCPRPSRLPTRLGAGRPESAGSRPRRPRPTRRRGCCPAREAASVRARAVFRPAPPAARRTAPRRRRCGGGVEHRIDDRRTAASRGARTSCAQVPEAAR